MPFDAVFEGLLALGQPEVIGYLFLGVAMGVIFGLIPGLHGIVAVALMLPFALTLDNTTAIIVMLVAILTATQTSNTFSAVLFNLPGTPTAAATLLDGYPMAQKGEAARALSAAFVASCAGGVVSALLLGASIPVVRPFVMAFASPERLILIVIGIMFIGTLGSSAPAKGLLAALLGFLISMVGLPAGGQIRRYTMDVIYFVQGVPLVPLVMGLYGLAELIAFMGRQQIATADAGLAPDSRAQVMQGVRDNVEHWPTVVRGGFLGAFIGAIPGLGGTAAAFFAYGAEARRKGSEGFGSGEVAGVIAPESANNASQAGELIPTLAFGVPGGASTAILLSVFIVVGYQPGQAAVTTNLPITLSMVWAVAAANVIAAAVCAFLLRPFAALTFVRSSLLAPLLVVFMLVGSAATTRSHWDLVVTFVFGVLGYYMMRFGWPRAPLLVAFVLGGLAEQYFILSYGNYGWGFLLRPIVMAIIGFVGLTVALVFVRSRTAHRDRSGAGR